MRNIFVISVVLVLMTQELFCQNTYYISNSGNNLNNGLSQSIPWETIEKLNAVTLNPGDSVLFERGGVYIGQIQANYSGNSVNHIYYGAYGTGEKPVISGAVKLNLLTGSQTNVYGASISNEVKALYVHNKKSVLARKPNKGFYTIEVGSKNSLTDNINLLGTSDFFKSGNVRFRSSNFTFESKEISSSSNGTINWTGESVYAPSGGYGYYLDNLQAFLDSNNEWYYDKVNEEIQYYSTQSISGAEALAIIYDYGVLFGTNKSYITIENLHFKYQFIDGIYLYGTVNEIDIINCRFSEIERHALNFAGTYNGIHINDNEFLDIYGSGIMANDLNNGDIFNNTFNRIGLWQGYGGTFGHPFNNNSAIAIKGNQLHVHHNFVDSTGYHGIRVDGRLNLIEKNYVKNTVLTHNDGGGLYSWGEATESSTFRNNIIDNIVGNTDGTPGEGLIIAGIYLDNNSHDMRVENNTIVRSSNMGILCNTSTRRDTIENNLIFDFVNGIAFSESIDDITNIDNCVKSNKFVCMKEDGLFVAKSTTDTTDNYIPGTFTNNTYYNPYNALCFKSSKYGGTHMHRHFSIEAWRNEMGVDFTSKNTYEGWQLYNPVDTTASNLINNSTFDSNLNGWSKWTNGSAILSYEASSILDGGALKLINTSTASEIAFSINVLKSGFSINQWYELSFSIVSSQLGNVMITPKRHYGSYNGFGPFKTFPFGLDRKNYRWIFESPENIDPARVDFQISPTDGDYTLDNVYLFPVNVEYQNPKDIIVAFYNPSDKKIIVDLNDTVYMKLDSTLICENFELEPWSSIALIKLERSCTITNINDEIVNSKGDYFDGGIYPNPAQDIIFTKNKVSEMELYNAMGVLLLKDKDCNSMDVKDIKSGIYFISIDGVVHKIIIKK